IVSRALLRSVAVVRFRIWLATALASGAIAGTLLHAQVSEAEKSRRNESEQIATHVSPSPKPKKSPSPTAKASRNKSEKKRLASATPEKVPTAIPHAKLAKEESTSDDNASQDAQDSPRPRADERATAAERPTPAPKALGAAAPTPAPSAESKVPRATPSGERAQVVIEKSGLEEDQGLEPAPTPPPRRGFWPWSRSSSNYRYLTRSVIEAIRRAPVKRRRWQFIVVHNSGTRQGNARVFDYYHRHVRRMQNGLAYH